LAQSKESKQQAAEQEVERFQEALGPFVVAAETTRMAMLFTDAAMPNWPIIFANDSFVALMGYAREEILGRDFDFFFAVAGDADVRNRVESAAADGAGAPLEVECRRKDGHVFLASLYICPVRDEGGKIVQYFSSLVDLTVYAERKIALSRVLSLQTELIHLSRVSAMGSMAATLGHELNQPLTAIANHAAGCRLLLAAGAPSASAIEADLRAIEKCAMRAGAIIGRLRNMTRGGPSRRESFDLNDAVRESVELVRAGACQGVRIEADVDGVVMIDADRVQIQQVVLNLVRNGCEAAAGLPDARVTLSTKVEGDQAVVSVDDTGLGITAEQSAGLFEWSNSAKPEGMGVGLSISRTIVEDHKGAIWLERRSKDRTRFRFSVPLVSEAAPHLSGASIRSGGQASAHADHS
jgi:PAS domain S-box-containing protein